MNTMRDALGPHWYAEVEASGTLIRAMVDTGFSVTVMVFSMFHQVGIKGDIPAVTLRKPSVTL